MEEEKKPMAEEPKDSVPMGENPKEQEPAAGADDPKPEDSTEEKSVKPETEAENPEKQELTDPDPEETKADEPESGEKEPENQETEKPQPESEEPEESESGSEDSMNPEHAAGEAEEQKSEEPASEESETEESKDQDSEESEPKEKKNKKRTRQIVILIVICLLLAGLCAVGYYLYQRVNSGLFFEQTTINGYDVTDQGCEQVLKRLERDYSAPKLTVFEDTDKEALTLTLQEMGYTIDEKQLLESIEDCMRDQNKNLIISLFEGNEYEVNIPFVYDEEVFLENVTSASFADGREPSANATLEYSEDENEYYIEPEVYGNVIDDADLQVMVKDYADKVVEEDRPQKDGTIEIPDTFYFLPEITQDDEEMNNLMNIYNSYCKAKITLTFGDEKVTLNWDTLQDWLIIDGDEVSLDRSKAETFVADLAEKYDTLHNPRTFTTSTGSTINYDGSDYGYRIDQEAEVEQLLADITSNTEVSREPVYSDKGLKRNGTDDICGTYVEVSLTAQHLWYYKDGSLVIETDVVTGKPTEDRETMTGVFTIPYKEKNVTLKGGSGSSSWSTPVTYWMPFYNGQGLHDASWRSSFGGNIYKSNGSHGCVNMPPAAAKTVYEEMEERTAIFLYK